MQSLSPKAEGVIVSVFVCTDGVFKFGACACLSNTTWLCLRTNPPLPHQTAVLRCAMHTQANTCLTNGSMRSYSCMNAAGLSYFLAVTRTKVIAHSCRRSCRDILLCHARMKVSHKGAAATFSAESTCMHALTLKHIHTRTHAHINTFPPTHAHSWPKEKARRLTRKSSC